VAGSSGCGTGHSLTIAQPADWSLWANNIVYDGSSSGGIFDCAIGNCNSGVNNQANNNLVFNTVVVFNRGTQTGTITGDPKFVNVSTNDYHLLTGSPAIGAGVLNAPDHDIDGKTWTPPITIGAYVYP
jgi:hypothetical protein